MEGRLNYPSRWRRQHDYRKLLVNDVSVFLCIIRTTSRTRRNGSTDVCTAVSSGVSVKRRRCDRLRRCDEQPVDDRPARESHNYADDAHNHAKLDPAAEFFLAKFGWLLKNAAQFSASRIFFGWISADIFTADFSAEPNFFLFKVNSECFINHARYIWLNH